MLGSEFTGLASSKALNSIEPAHDIGRYVSSFKEIDPNRSRSISFLCKCWLLIDWAIDLYKIFGENIQILSIESRVIAVSTIWIFSALMSSSGHFNFEMRTTDVNDQIFGLHESEILKILGTFEYMIYKFNFTTNICEPLIWP